jgi:hypothetical protein
MVGQIKTGLRRNARSHQRDEDDDQNRTTVDASPEQRHAWNSYLNRRFRLTDDTNKPSPIGPDHQVAAPRPGHKIAWIVVCIDPYLDVLVAQDTLLRRSADPGDSARERGRSGLSAQVAADCQSILANVP